MPASHGHFGERTVNDTDKIFLIIDSSLERALAYLDGEPQWSCESERLSLVYRLGKQMQDTELGQLDPEL